jgi:hypothetical protein
MKTKPAKPLPKTFARKAAEHAEQAVSRARLEAETLLELILSRRRNIEDAFYDVGEALVKLREPRLFGAIGASSFRDLVQNHLHLSTVHAHKLVGIAQQLSRKRALELGQERAAALVRLARASSDTDSAETLARDGVSLPGRAGRISPTEVSVRELLAAAHVRHQLRAANEVPTWSEARREVSGAIDALRERLVQAGVEGAATKVSLHPLRKTVSIQVRFAIESAWDAAVVLRGRRTR